MKRVGVLQLLRAHLALPLDALRVAVPLTIYFVAMFVLAFAAGRALKADYPRATALSFTAAITGFWRSRCNRGINYPIKLSKSVSDAKAGRGVAPLLQRFFITQQSTGTTLQAAAKVDP